MNNACSNFSFKFLLSLAFLVGVSGCNYTKLKNVGDGGDSGILQLSEEEKAKLSFASIKDSFYEKKCMRCHKEGSINGSFDTYPRIVENLELIKRAVFVKQTMPKSGSLSALEKAQLFAWLEMGAPENTRSVPGQPNPNPQPSEPIKEPEILANYDSIRKNIFEENSCFQCHTWGETGELVSLEKEGLLEPNMGLVIPGKPDESPLVKALERNDDKRMPPIKDGFPAVKQEHINLIRKWIQNGAKD